MKAIILTAGVGSRIRPLTDNTPKCLLDINGKTILERMVENVSGCGITQFVVITGYLQEQVTSFITEHFPRLKFSFVHNEKYAETNTAYSLYLTRKLVEGDSFIKLDGDVVFEKAVVEKLINDQNQNCLCMDKNIRLATEEVKVSLGENNKVLKVGKKIPPQAAQGESIGIEKLSAEGGVAFYNALEQVLKDPKNNQEYYDDSYTTLVERGVPFYATDITGLKWVEIDTHEDYQKALEFFK